MLKQTLLLAWRWELQLRAAWIPSKLNTASDAISRAVTAAQAADFTFSPRLFARHTQRRVEVILFSDNEGRSARLLLPTRSPPPTYFSPTNSAFLQLHALCGRRLWFNPPLSLLEDTLAFIVRLRSLDPTTAAMGIIPHLEDRQLFSKWVGQSHHFQEVAHYPRGSRIFLNTGTARFRKVPIRAYRAFREQDFLAAPSSFAWSVIATPNWTNQLTALR